MTDTRAAQLEALWEEHLRHEFETQRTDATLDTMVEHAYVNHIPTITGGVGHKALGAFYSNHFIPKMPPDTEIEAISRTIGEDTIVDEFVFQFTHTVEMDWMLPGVAPTGRKVAVPFVVIVHFEGDKLAHEHIYWDQASVLVQIGLLDAANLPITGADAADKVRDPKRVASNQLNEESST